MEEDFFIFLLFFFLPIPNALALSGPFQSSSIAGVTHLVSYVVPYLVVVDTQMGTCTSSSSQLPPLPFDELEAGQTGVVKEQNGSSVTDGEGACDNVGPAVGGGVGSEVGEEVVGEKVGAVVGPGVGIVVGDGVGLAVTNGAVGAVVGASVGAVVGLAVVGDPVGTAVGTAVEGADDGGDVGSGQ